ncbi:MAG: response regulator, partial [Chitinivibrionales bacterium]|nr:response regulator [Chitinivibrionales bacterium]MBD3394470.1 response regulator [Chitinivibrionales bacterium]
MSTGRILVVDDDAHVRASIVEVISRMGFAAEGCGSGGEALKRFEKGAWDMVVSDVKMPGISGIELLQKVKAIDAEVPFVIITAYGAVDMAVDAMKQGAYDFIQKGENLLDVLEMNVRRTLEYRTLVKENRLLKDALEDRWRHIGETAVIQDIRGLVGTVAESRSTVLVSGESGTGKELIARSIHYLSPRQQGPFVKVNCAALPEGLIESEMFGHEKGAFTGALRSKTGKFEYASGGTLLLDEIGEMPVGVQAKLLRVLQEREINKVGGEDPIAVDVRIVATTNRNLEEAIESGTFREDLYYRLNVFHIHLPPLRERMDDIPLLVDHFVRKYNGENGFTVEGVDAKCVEVLRKHTWPGNIRELENTIERAVVLTKTGTIHPDVLSMKSVG